MKIIVNKAKGYLRLNLATELYSLATIYAASYVFLERSYVYLDKDSNGRIIIYLFAKNKKDNLKRLGMDFCNELLNYAHYHTSLKANAEVMKTLIQRALFSASPSLIADMSAREIEQLGQQLQEEENKVHL